MVGVGCWLWVVVQMGCNFCSFSEQDLGVHIDMCPIVSAGPPQRGAQPGLGWAGWVGGIVGHNGVKSVKYFVND